MEYNADFLRRIGEMLMSTGLKNLTMDRVASKLGISKRTLYEIFPSKKEMIRAVLDYSKKEHISRCEAIFARSENVIDGMLKVHLEMRNLIARMNPSFFHDMDEAFSDLRPKYEELENSRDIYLMDMFEKGVEEGVFRSDVNFIVQSKMLQVQGEALKRMEELFPPDMTLVEVYDAIILGFLRSIASEKGLNILNHLASSDKQ